MANENKDGPKSVKPHLRDLRDLTPEERKEFAVKGGKASGEAAKKRRKLREVLLLLLEDEKVQNDCCKALLKQVRRGNTRAFEVMRDTIGEKPVDVHKLEEPVVVKKVFISAEEKAAVDSHIEEALRDGN